MIKAIFKLKYGYLIFLLAFVFHGCCQDQDPKKRGCQNEKPITETGPFPLGVSKDYLYFKPGSWWVYKNNLTNELDSIVTITCDTTSISFKEEYPSTIYHTTFTSIRIYQKSYSFDYNIYYECDRIAPDGYALYLDKTTVFPKLARNSIPYVYPFRPETYFIELIPSLVISGKTYTDVAVFQIWSDESVQLPTLSYGFKADAPTKYFWAKGIGLIKIEQGLFRFDTQQTFTHKWELINYNVIK